MGGIGASYGAPPGFPNRLYFNDSQTDIPSLTNKIVMTKKEIRPENEDKKEQDEEKEVKTKLGLENFMNQQKDFKDLREMIDDTESKFNGLNTFVCKYLDQLVDGLMSKLECRISWICNWMNCTG
jgi:hypothetical protein